MGYLTMVLFFTEDYIFFAVAFLILAVCFAAAAAVKLKKKRRSGRIFAVSAAVCLLFMGKICYDLNELRKIPPCIIPPYIDSTYTEKLIDLTGMDYNEAKAEYSKYFNMTVAMEIYSSEYPAGAIIEHSPRAGTMIRMGNSEGNASEVRCKVSRGPQMIMVPNTYKLDIDIAGQMIDAVGLTYSITDEYSETVPEGCVISTNPERNEVIERGSTVNIVVSKGSEGTLTTYPKRRPLPIIKIKKFGRAGAQMTKFYDIISPVDMAIITFPYLLSLIFLLAFICLFVEIITDVSRKKSPGRRHIVLTVISAIICCGLAYAIKEYPPDHGHGNDNVCPQAMVNLVGYDYNECKSLYASYFDMEIDKEIYSSEYPAGTIIEQSPREGSFIEVGHTTVKCVVSKGKQMIIMPNVCGVSYENACNMLEDAGLNHIAGCYQFSETVPRGWAISTEPKAGEEAEADSMVYIYVSMGKEETSAETEEVYSDEYPEGTAISQNPEEGSHIEEGNTNAD